VLVPGPGSDLIEAHPGLTRAARQGPASLSQRAPARSNHTRFLAVSISTSTWTLRQQNPGNSKGTSMRLTLVRLAAGLALLTTLAAGCSTASTHHAPATAHKPASPASAATHMATPVQAPVAEKHAARHFHRAKALPPPAPSAPAPTMNPMPTMNPIPQGNGGDQDFDNNGGPSDGDGNI